jgi:hypothetical protein
MRGAVTMAEAHRLAPSATEIEVLYGALDIYTTHVLLHGPVPEEEIMVLQAALEARMPFQVWKVRLGDADR